MGYLTTITFYNDAAHDLRKHPEEVSKLIYDAQGGVQKNRGRNYDPVGSHANPVIIQRPRHADDTTLYLHAGNTVIDLAEADSEWAINTAIAEIKWRLKDLQAKKKELENNKKEQK
jgi:hypothetical protein